MWNNPLNVYDFLLLAHDQETIIKEHLNTRRKIGIEFLSGISTTNIVLQEKEFHTVVPTGYPTNLLLFCIFRSYLYTK